MIIPEKYFKAYLENQPITISKHLKKIKERPMNFGYAVSYSAVYSSQIEGNLIDIDTYFRYNETGMNTKTKSFREIKQLEKAYLFAQKHKLTEKNMLKAHYILSDIDNFEDKYKGKYRDKNVYVMHGPEIIYTGIEPDSIENEMKMFFTDIKNILAKKISFDKTFYYASFIHLIFVLIHPFADGNGRTARLIEKWFLSEKLGTIAWSIPSEYLYARRRKSYQNNIRKLGKSYNDIDYSKSISFLKMLPMALRIKI